MRKGYHDYKFLEDKKTLIGVSLGYDFCAEHEWGVKKLLDNFGVPEGKCLFNDSKIKKVNSTGGFFNKKEKQLIIYKEKDGIGLLRSLNSYSSFEYESFDDLIPYDLRFSIGTASFKEKGLVTAWDGEEFGVISNDTEKLKELYNEFLNKNVCFKFLGSDNPFGGNGLCILIVDRTPQSIKDKHDNLIKDSIALEKEVKISGLKKLMDSKKKSKYSNDYDPNKGHKDWMALSPKRANTKDSKTKYNFLVWANYPDGDDKGYGWYTCEDVMEWLKTPNIKLSEVKEKNNPKPNPETHTISGHKIPKKVREQLKNK